MSTETQLKISTPGERLKRAREHFGISQLNFAISLGYDKYNPIKDIETGVTKLKIPIARLIEKLYGVSEKWLLDGNGEMLSREDHWVGKKNERQEEDERLSPTSKAELMGMTSAILDSDTVYRPALVSNIRAFHYGVEQLRKSDEKIDRLERKIDELMRMFQGGGADTEKKRAGNDH